MSQETYAVLRYQDAQAAIHFLENAFGFEESTATIDDDGTILHGELELGGAVVLINSAKPDDPFPAGPTATKDPGGNVWSYGTYRPQAG